MNLHTELWPIVVPVLVAAAHLLQTGVRLYAAARREDGDGPAKARLAIFPGVWDLQLATNRLHRVAVFQKAYYQAVGIIIVLGVPSLMVSHALQSTAAPGSDHRLFFEFIVAAVVAAVVFLFPRPTAAWSRARMRAEALRLHTHLCLGLLPPYRRDQAPHAGQVVAHVEELGMQEICAHIEGLVRELEAYRAQPEVCSVDGVRASAYDVERIQEQLKYFEGTAGVLRRLLDGTSHLFRGSLLCACAAAFVRYVFRDDIPGSAWLGIVAVVQYCCVAAVTFTLTLRAVFGWESRLGVYEAMKEKQQAWRQWRRELDGGVWGDPADARWQATFKTLAVSIELEMAQEALAWLQTVRRELYEAPI